MNKFKRISALIVAAMLALTLVSCGGDEESSAASKAQSQATTSTASKADDASKATSEEEVANEETEISLEEARKIVDDIEIGEIIIGNELPMITFGRVAAGTAKQVVMQKLRELEREKKQLVEDNISLKQDVRNLKTKIEVLAESDGGSTTNADMLRRISKLEKIIYGKE